MERDTGPTRIRVTMSDVARLANVDRSVVSRVINNDPRLHVREETRQRVIDAIEQLGYRPNAAARSLRTARAYAYGMLIPSFHNPVYASIIIGAELEARRRDSLLLTGSALEGTDAFESFLELLGEGRVDGLLVGGVSQHAFSALDIDDTLPVLAINRRDPSRRRYVILDDEAAGREAVAHLIELGHRRIAHIAGPSYADTAVRRRQGYEAALEHARLEVVDDMVVEGEYTPEGGEAAMTELVQREVGLTAVFVANFASAVGALAALQKLGLRVPDDVSVVTVHDHPLGDYLTPPLTTVRLPLERLGQRAIELLATTRPDDVITEMIPGPVELIRRRTTSGPP